MTFEEFQATRRFVDRLGEDLAAGWGAEAGYVYADDFWIVAGPDDNIRTVYLVVTPTDETTFDTLEAAERHLYEWAKDELWIE